MRGVPGSAAGVCGTGHAAAMELAQMIVQAVWDSESPLKQLPHVSTDTVKRCKEAGIESVFDLMDAEVCGRGWGALTALAGGALLTRVLTPWTGATVHGSACALGGGGAGRRAR